MGQKYLVLRPFNSYGRYFRKGDVVDAAEIRTPSLRMSEGKIIPAVSSAKVPEDVDTVVVEAAVETPPESSKTEAEDTNAETPAEKKSIFNFATPK